VLELDLETRWFDRRDDSQNSWLRKVRYYFAVYYRLPIVGMEVKVGFHLVVDALVVGIERRVSSFDDKLSPVADEVSETGEDICQVEACWQGQLSAAASISESHRYTLVARPSLTAAAQFVCKTNVVSRMSEDRSHFRSDRFHSSELPTVN
jgi:hypothetical protein